MIEVEDLTKRYGDHTAVHNVSFGVERGEIVGFLGPNGAGKTTTLRMITGFLAPTHGKIRVDGIDALGSPVQARQRIGYMSEGVPLYPELRVHEYLKYRAELKGVGAGDVAGRVGASLEMAGIEDVRDRIVGQLSKGYRQRVGLADALVADPPLLILDEPTSGLDPNQIRQVRELVRGFAGDKTVLVSTHILPEVEATCGRVIIINKGKLVGEGTPDTLRERGGDEGQVLTLVVRATGGTYRDAPAERVSELVGGVEGVHAVENAEKLDPEVVRVTARTDESPEILERVASAVIEAGLLLRELRGESAKLEDVFTELTTTEPAAEEDPEQEPEDEEPEEETDEEKGEDETEDEDEDAEEEET